MILFYILFPLPITTFCHTMPLWSSFDRFLSIIFEKNKIFENIVIIAPQSCLWSCRASMSKYHLFWLPKSMTAEILDAFAVLVKVLAKIINFEFWTTSTNMMKFCQEKFYPPATILNAPFLKIVGGCYSTPHYLSNDTNTTFFLTWEIKSAW